MDKEKTKISEEQILFLKINSKSLFSYWPNYYSLAHAQSTLDQGTSFKHYVPKINDQKNPRLQALDNFKEISRIMTKNFLAHKQLEKRFEKTVIPKAERDKLRTENEA